ncbi:MAG: GyrI-like domain-containing protein [Bacteroidia bacterium]|nr:GyrI-like domain-containing protein [Bacteroidia bacterium]
MEKSPPKEYIARVNKALQFIDENLDKSLSLEMVAKEANYSPFHFHRIFSTVINEPLNAYISRKKLEKSAAKLIEEKEKSIYEIALDFAWSNNATFSKAFKKYFGLSPTEFRKRSKNFSKIGKTKSKNGQIETSFDTYIRNIESHKEWLSMHGEVEIKQMPDIPIAFVTHIGDFGKAPKAFHKLKRWADPRGLFTDAQNRSLTVYHDDPNITDLSRLRSSVAIILEEAIEADGEIGIKVLKASRCVCGSFKIGFNEFEKAWQSMFVWLYEHGYNNPKRDCFEIYYPLDLEQKRNKIKVEIYLPID